MFLQLHRRFHLINYSNLFSPFQQLKEGMGRGKSERGCQQVQKLRNLSLTRA